MLQAEISHSVFRPQRPPLWYVTNGDLTVGPVDTTLLVRGVERGRVPEYCHVRAFTGDWRQLHRVREIAAMSSGLANGPSSEQLAEWGQFIQGVRDEDELCHTVNWLSLVAAGAEAAMFHYRGRHGQSLFTRSVLGPASNGRLGYPLSEFDLVLCSARRAIPVHGTAYGPTADLLSRRLASTEGADVGQASAVAMIPIFLGRQLTAMIELSRPGHAFRRSDLERIERVVKTALNARSSS